MAISSNTASASTPWPGEHVAQERLVPQRLALVVTEGEQRAVDGGEPLGEPVADDDADLQGQQAAVAVGLVPDVGVALLDVGLAEREGDEPDVPVGTAGQAGERRARGRCGRRGSGSPR